MTDIVPVPCKLVGINGNSFSILGAVSESMRKNGQGHNVAQFREEATSGDYDKVIQTAIKYTYDAPSNELAQPDEENEYVECQQCGNSADELTPIFVINDGRFRDEWMCQECYDDAYTCPECGNETDEDGECEACNAYQCAWCLNSDYYSSINIEWRSEFEEELCDSCYESEMEDRADEDDDEDDDE